MILRRLGSKLGSKTAKQWNRVAKTIPRTSKYTGLRSSFLENSNIQNGNFNGLNRPISFKHRPYEHISDGKLLLYYSPLPVF